MIKKFKEDRQTSIWFAIKELWFNLHSGKKSIITYFSAIGFNYWLYKHSQDVVLWIFVLSTEYFIGKIFEKYAYETEHNI